ncbi:MAG: VOC family protein [Acidimicrobiales bacterium]
MAGVRLRQVALVVQELEPVVAKLREVLGVDQEPFRDPGIKVFGLHNAVLEVGDTFVEVVSPVEEGTTAGRYLERRGGDGGYMAIFQMEDLESARSRIDDLGIRVVWRSDLVDIAGTHLHPKDLPGALVSIDWARPAESWRWAGPRWIGGAPEFGTGGVVGVTVQCDDPEALAARWGAVLDRPPVASDDASVVPLDGGEVRFVHPADDRGEGIGAFEVARPGAESGEWSVGGVRVVLRPSAS